MSERERRQRIIDHLRAGEPRSAAAELAGSREQYPGDELLHHAIGLAFASNGTLGAAREQLEAAAELSPSSAIILTDLAQVRLAQGKPDEAIESADAALELDPSLAIAQFTLGRACLLAESARQSRNLPAPPPGFDFPLLDGRAPAYLRALRAMENALESAPPFSGAIRAALAFAYLRAGHHHAALEQLRAQLLEVGAGEEADRVADRIHSLECEIARETYWSAIMESSPSAPGHDDDAELLLRAAHIAAVSGDEEAFAQAMAQARCAGYAPRPAAVARSDAEDGIYQELSDVHSLIAGGLECVCEGALRFLPFAELDSVTLGPVTQWRQAGVRLTSGDALEVAVPLLYRHSIRSPNDLIQSGRFTQFKYAPGESRYARAIGSRNLATETGVIPFADVTAIRFI
jgi:protein involved in temperature-dependent protein secretion